jgi:hypothetical protein
MVNDCPRFLTDQITDLTHSIVIPVDESDQPYVIPLTLQGVTSSFPTRKPTVAEYESLPHLSLTSDEPTYDPYDVTFAEQEEALTEIPVGARGPCQRTTSIIAVLCGLQQDLIA